MKRTIITLTFVLSLLLGFVLWHAEGGARAASAPITVNSAARATDDPSVGGASDPTNFMVTCTANPVVVNTNDSGAGSLRQAILDACPGSAITFAANVTGTITLTSGDLAINKDLTIQGPGANLLTINGNNAFRLFYIDVGPINVTIAGLNLINGNGNGAVNIDEGGAVLVRNRGTTTLREISISSSTAVLGGAIEFTSGGLGTTLNLIRSTLSGNTSSLGAGGIELRSNGVALNVVNSTIAGNQTSSGRAGGIGMGFNSPVAVTLVNSTITNNQGGGLALIQTGSANVRNTLLTLNSGGDFLPQVGPTFVSNGYNIFGTGIPAGAVQPTDQVGVNPLFELDGSNLPKLAFNGGPTQTIKLLPGSPALDKGAAANDPSTNQPLTTDQRNFPRPVDFPGITNASGGDGSDIGAHEQSTLAVNRVTASLADPIGCTGPGGAVSVTATVTNGVEVPQATSFTANLPASLLALPGTCSANVAGTCLVVNASTVTWAGTLNVGQTVTITYQAQIADFVTPNTQICVTSSATIGGNPIGSVTACTTVNCAPPGPGGIFPAASEASAQSAGSVLIYNIYTSGATSGNTQNTRVNLTNIHPTRPAFVHLFFVAEGCSVADSYVCLTGNQTTSFLASDLDPGVSGYLVAVAVDGVRGCPTNFNYLIGDEYVKFATGHAANLGAEAISALAGGLPACDGNSVTAQLDFNGIAYDKVSHLLALDNVGSKADGNDTLLILNRIGGNLGTGAGSLSSVFGIFYDDAENALSFTFSGGHQFRSSLSNNFPRITPRFETYIPAGRTGWFKLWPTTSGLWGMTGAAINFNANAASSSGAFNQGHNLHKLTLTNTASYIIPVFPPSC